MGNTDAFAFSCRCIEHAVPRLVEGKIFNFDALLRDDIIEPVLIWLVRDAIVNTSIIIACDGFDNVTEERGSIK